MKNQNLVPLGLAICLALVVAQAFADSGTLSSPPVRLAPSSGQSPDPNAAAVAETKTYLRRLEKLGFAGVVLVAKGDVPLFAEGFGLADREHGVRWTSGTISD
ncbi:MAG: hypothetical protein ACXW2H_08815, partial [Candidatus Aminicenantales bacterium]